MRIITFDELKIEVIHKCHLLTNRDPSYPFFNEQLPLSHLKFEYMIGIALYTIPADTLK